MFNEAYTDPNSQLLVDRLARIAQQLRSITLSTMSDYQAEVYSAVNAVLSLGVAMTPLDPVGGQGPAVVGDAANNFTILNNDAADIAAETLRVEDTVADSFNLAATTLNQLRQQIREFIYQNNQQRFSEDFLNSQNLSGVSANLDFNAGLATSPVVSTVTLSPTISIGTDSVGEIDSNSSLNNLTADVVGEFFQWDGSSLELILTFPTAQIMNRITINLDNYSNMEISTFTTTPDGTLIQDVLDDLGVNSIDIDGTSNKFSGDVIIDFPPRYVLTARLVLLDRSGTDVISIRNLTCEQISYSSTGQLTSIPITAPTGTVAFSTIQNVFSPYVTITHQLSYNGTQFTAIDPGDTIVLNSTPFFYRAVFGRSASAFSAQSPLNQSPLDPVGSPYYTLTTSTSTPLGNGIIERTLQINDITGPIILRETPLPNSLVVQEGTVILSLSAQNYVFNDNTVAFPTNVTGITITYQTSSLGSAAISDLENYYTPLLYEYKFEVS
jgi:hypothetical protein